MTKHKKLKRAVRARSAKTGESYTAARAQILRSIKSRAGAPPKQPASSKGAVSDDAVRANTGKPLAHWFRVLDEFGAKERGHTQSARHLRDDLGVSGWYSQGITVAYERARGLRVENQACDGKFQVSVSRVVAATVSRVVDAMQKARQRALWLDGADPALIGALEEGLAKRSFGRKGADAKLRFRWDASTVEVYVGAKPDGRATVVVANTGLASKADVEPRRASWRSALDALRRHLSE